MMSFKKVIISSALSMVLLLGNVGILSAQQITYKVNSGDTYWIIAQKFGVPIDNILKLNNANQYSVLYTGQNILIPDGNNVSVVHIVQSGDTFWIISQKYGVDINKLIAFNGGASSTNLLIGQQIMIPQTAISPSSTPTPTHTPSPTQVPSKPYITYTYYAVQKGDTGWSIAIKFGIPEGEVLSANGLNQYSRLNIGDKLKIPVHHIPVKSTPGEKYGEYLDWWTEAQYVVPVNSVFEVVDFYTGKSFMVKRTTGANHADCETATLADTKKMKEIWGGYFSWTSRPVIIKLNGRKIAASSTSMPHAGNDAAAGGLYTSWRSGGYGAGPNFDWVKGNGIDGHFDIHFLNSTRHKDGEVDWKHQANLKIAAGK